MNKEEFILNIRPANGEPSKEYVMRLNTKLLLENEQLKEKVKELENVIVTDDFNFAKPILKEYVTQILKSRIDKAIEYINWSLEANEELTDMGIGLCVNNVEVLLEILKGGSNE